MQEAKGESGADRIGRRKRLGAMAEESISLKERRVSLIKAYINKSKECKPEGGALPLAKDHRIERDHLTPDTWWRILSATSGRSSPGEALAMVPRRWLSTPPLSVMAGNRSGSSTSFGFLALRLLVLVKWHAVDKCNYGKHIIKPQDDCHYRSEMLKGQMPSVGRRSGGLFIEWFVN
nr:hypothetical protein Iba_chr14aCG10880 [Ipomoea batatas]